MVFSWKATTSVADLDLGEVLVCRDPVYCGIVIRISVLLVDSHYSGWGSATVHPATFFHSEI